MATKEKINLLEVIPCRNEHIKAEQEGETIVLSFPRFKRSWMSRYLLPKGMSKDIHVFCRRKRQDWAGQPVPGDSAPAG